jgi:hypothetical protein
MPSLRWLSQASKSAQVTALFVIASLLAIESHFALRCHLEQKQMARIIGFSQHRDFACRELGWRWEADDQENQYQPGTSAGTHVTVGPIDGFVMDVTEDESGHAQGQCHAATASYSDLLSQQ